MQQHPSAAEGSASLAGPPPVVVTLPDGRPPRVSRADQRRRYRRRDRAGPRQGGDRDQDRRPSTRPRHAIDRDAAVAIVTRDIADGLEILRHDAAHVMAEAVKELYPETQVTFGPATENGLLLRFRPRRRRSRRTTSTQIEARMREIVDRDEKITPRGLGPRRGGRLLSRHRRELQGRIYRRDPGRRGDQPLPPGRFRRSVHRAASALDRRLGQAFKLMNVAGAYWRGDPRNAQLQRIYGTAWAEPEGARPISLSAGGGRAPRPPQARPRARPVSSAARRRSAASSGIPRAGRSTASIESYMRMRLDACRLSRGQGPAAARPEPVGSLGPLGEVPRQHVHRREQRRTSAGAEADELPRPCADLPQPPEEAIANCRCGWPSSAAATATSHRARCTASCACAPSPRTMRTSSAPRSRSPRKSVAFCRAAAVDLPRFRLRGRGGQIRRPARRCAPARDAVWDRAEADLRAAVEAAGLAYAAQSRARAPFMGRSSNSFCATRSAATGSAAPCSSTSCCRSGSTPAMSARTVPATDRPCCTGRSSVRSSGSSAC